MTEHKWIVTLEDETFTFSSEEKAREYAETEAQMTGKTALLLREAEDGPTPVATFEGDGASGAT